MCAQLFRLVVTRQAWAVGLSGLDAPTQMPLQMPVMCHSRTRQSLMFAFVVCVELAAA